MKRQGLINTAALVVLRAMGAILRNDGSAIEKLEQKLIDLNAQAHDLQNLADAEGRPLTNEEADQVDSILSEYKTIEADIERRKVLLENSASLEEGRGRKTLPNDMVNKGGEGQPARKTYREPIDPVAKNQHGFRTFGEFASIVAKTATAHQQGIRVDTDKRLIVDAPTTYGNEGVGADGGFAVPPGFKAEIMQSIEAEDELMGLCDELTTTSNNMTFPKDETTPWQTTGGIQTYWEAEAAQITQSKPALKQQQHRLKKVTALVPITEEMAEDAGTIDSYLRRKVPENMAFKINDAIINGTGAGMPLGFMNSGALVTVAKETGQAADTIVAENITKMWARMYAPSRRTAVWLHNQDIEPQLDTLGFPTSATAVPLYMPPGGLADTPYGRLKGRPLIATQAAATLGDLGDIMLVDLKKYMILKKTVGLRSDVSMHLWFDYDTLAYRFILRIDGAPYHSAPIDPKNGTNTLSPFVTLAARA